MTLPQDIIGVDISKDWIDCHRLSSGSRQRVRTTPAMLRRFAAKAAGALVVFEASGGYERPLAGALDTAGVAYARINPRQAREFARASGRLAKTDRVDAEVLAEFGRALAPRPTPPADPAATRLAELVARRDDLVGMRKAETQRLGQVHDPFLRQQIAAMLRVLRHQIARLEAEVAAYLDDEPALAERAARLRGVPGIGQVLAAGLVARLPELGRLDRRAIASIAGLAPHACDSGTMRGRRRIWGGRADVRRMLYLAAFVASRHDPRLRAFRERLQDAGKPFKLAIIACARKLLTILNAMLRTGTEYAARPPA
jgi:transposase